MKLKTNQEVCQGRVEEMKVFKDKNGIEIKPGDILRLKYFARWRERPGHKRVAIEGMSEREVIVPDEGRLKDEVEEGWADYKVKWSGACLIVELDSYSDFQTLAGARLFNEKGENVRRVCNFEYCNEVFDPSIYEVKR